MSQVQKGPASPFSRKTGNNKIAVIVVVVQRKLEMWLCWWMKEKKHGVGVVAEGKQLVKIWSCWCSEEKNCGGGGKNRNVVVLVVVLYRERNMVVEEGNQ